MMKKTWMLLAAMVLALAACSKSDNTTAPAAAGVTPSAPVISKIVIGLDDNFPPMGFRDEQNKIVGFDIDLASEAVSRMGIEVEFKPIDWSSKEAELNSKRVDVLWNGLTITDARKKVISFTAPYMENHQIIVVKINSDINTKADLAAKVVGVQEGSSAVQAIEKEGEVLASFKELKLFGDNVTALMDLTTSRLDAVVVDEVVGRYYVAKKADLYRVLDQDFGTEEYGVGVRKDDTELLEKLSKALDSMKADGSAQKIAIKWFGADVIR